MNDLDFKQGLALFELALSASIILICVMQRCFNVNLLLKGRVLACAALLPLFLFPMGLIGFPWELPLVAYVRGASGDLSIVSLLLLWSYFFIPASMPISTVFKGGVIVIALLLYAFALGVGMMDPYAWGYGSLLFLLALLALIFCMWLAKWDRLVIIFALAILAWTFTLHESTNLWDYVLDPFLFLWCVGALLVGKK